VRLREPAPRALVLELTQLELGLLAARLEFVAGVQERPLDTPLLPGAMDDSGDRRVVAMLRQEPKTHKGTSNAVSRTSGKLMPSTPTAYWAPKGSIPSARSTNCGPPAL